MRDNVLGAVLDAALEPMLVADGDGLVVAANAACEALLGHPRGALCGRPIEALVPERQRLDHAAWRSQYGIAPRARPMGTGFEAQARRADGSEVAVEIGLTPLALPAGTLTLAVMRDLGDDAMRAGRLHEAGRQQTRFLASLSHQFRTPLNAIVGFADLVQQGHSGPLLPAQQEYLDDLLRSARQLLAMIDDVVDMAGLDAGRLELQPEPLNAADLIDDACAFQHGSILYKQIKLLVESKPVARIVSDRRRVQQVFRLLLGQAIAASHTGERITLRAQPDGDAHFRIEVEDEASATGTDELRDLLVEFHQPPAGGRQDTGVALPLARRVVEALGGRISAMRGPGPGTLVRVVLPRRLPGG